MIDKKSAAIIFFVMFIIAQGYNILSYAITSIPGFLLALLIMFIAMIKLLVPVLPFILLGLFLYAIITSAIIDSRKN